jgi:hypothetical protein
MFCSPAHQPEKCALTAKTYYVPMTADSACAQYFITTDQLIRWEAEDLADQVHSSKDWIQIIEDLRAKHNWTPGAVSTPMKTPAPDASTPKPSPAFSFYDAEEEVDAAQPSAIKSIYKSSALRMLSTTGLETIKSILPLASLFSKEGEDEDTKPAAVSVQAQLTTVTSSVETILKIMPDGFQELDDRFKEAIRLVEEEMATMSAAHKSLFSSLFDGSDPATFLQSFKSVASFITSCDSRLTVASEDLAELRENTDSNASALASIGSEIGDVRTKVEATESKTVELVQAVIKRFSREVSALASKMSGGKLDGVHVGESNPQPDLQALHFAAYHHRGTNRYTVGRNLREYERLTKNGWNPEHTFKTESEAWDWLNAKKSGSLSVSLAPSQPSVTGSVDAVAFAELKAAFDHSVQTNVDLQAKLEAVDEALRELKCSIAGSSGVKVDEWEFQSEDEIVELLLAEGVNPDEILGIAVDASSFYAHTKSGYLDTASASTEVRTMRSAGITNAVAFRYVNSFREQNPGYFLGESKKQVNQGDRYPMLDSEKAWEGTSIISGGRRDLERVISETSKSVDKFIKQNTKPGKLQSLCLHLSLITSQWWTALLAHINHELKTVGHYGIPEKETYTLASNELWVMLDAFWGKRQLMEEFSTERDKVLYAARTIFTTMETHMVMKEFKDPDFGTHVLISSIFTRFLAEQTGANFSSGLDSSLTQLRESIKKVDVASDKKIVAITTRLDAMTELLKKICAKTEVKFNLKEHRNN